MTPISICTECLIETVSTTISKAMLPLCTECATTYYVSCSKCNTLIPRDEAAPYNEGFSCYDCPSNNQITDNQLSLTDQIPDSEVAALVDEFILLHAEEKRVKDRLEEIKDALKTIAALRERVSNAVVLKSSREEQAVKCSFSQSFKADQSKIVQLERELEKDQFASLFKTEVKYTLIKEAIEEILSTTDTTRASIRDAILSSIEKIETPTLKPIIQKR
jgi:hypothetical protein